MDVNTGDRLALVSTPGFDPNAFNVGVTPAQWTALPGRSQAADQQALWAASIRRAPPSRPSRRWPRSMPACTRPTRFSTARASSRSAPMPSIAGRRAATAAQSAPGAEGSCDCYFYQVALKLGIDGLQAGARTAGSGRAHRHRNSRRTCRLHSRPGVETEDLQGALAAGRNPGRRHRSGLYPGDAAAALRAGRAHRQRQARSARDLSHSLGAQSCRARPVEPVGFSPEPWMRCARP